MAVEESLDKRRKDDPILLEAKRRAIDAYRKPFLEEMRRCACHCHMPVICGCPKTCTHCQPPR